MKILLTQSAIKKSIYAYIFPHKLKTFIEFEKKKRNGGEINKYGKSSQ